MKVIILVKLDNFAQLSKKDAFKSYIWLLQTIQIHKTAIKVKAKTLIATHYIFLVNLVNIRRRFQKFITIWFPVNLDFTGFSKNVSVVSLVSKRFNILKEGE